MSSHRFTSTLLRASANGFAGLAASRIAERTGSDDGLDGGFDAWQAHFRELVLELAAALEDGRSEQFAEKVRWTQDAMVARDLESDLLRVGLEELGGVLEESLTPEAWSALAPFFVEANERLDPPAAAAAGEREVAFSEVVDDYLAALDAGDAARAARVVADEVAAGRLTVPDAIDVLCEAQREVGERWHLDKITVAQEHFATLTTTTVLSQILAAAPKEPINERTVVLTMAAGDAHEFGVRVVAAFFELDGWRTICLGSNTPARDLSRLCDSFEADLVVLGATLNTQREQVSRTVAHLKEAAPERLVIIGGPAFQNAPIEHFPCDGYALEARDAVRIGRELLDLP